MLIQSGGKMRNAVCAALVAAVFGGGCVVAGPQLQVTPSRAVAEPSRPKPTNCPLDFYRTKAPDRPYVEVATLHFIAVNGADPAAAQAAIQAKVCEMGADGVVVTRERYLGYTQGGTEVTATAVAYRPGP